MSQDTSGWVKQAAGTVLWSSTCSRPHMFSTALMPCALAACASIYLPAPHHTPTQTRPLHHACLQAGQTGFLGHVGMTVLLGATAYKLCRHADLGFCLQARAVEGGVVYHWHLLCSRGGALSCPCCPGLASSHSQARSRACQSPLPELPGSSPETGILSGSGVKLSSWRKPT